MELLKLNNVKSKVKFLGNFRFLGNKYVILLLSYSFTALTITRYFLEAYSCYSFYNLPVGWDTPWYIHKINLAKEGLFLQVIQRCSFTNFLYPLIFSLLPFDSTQIEIFVPISIALLLPLAGYFFIKTTSKYNGVIAVFLMST